MKVRGYNEERLKNTFHHETLLGNKKDRFHEMENGPGRGDA